MMQPSSAREVESTMCENWWKYEKEQWRDDYSLQKYARKATNDGNDVQKKSEMED